MKIKINRNEDWTTCEQVLLNLPNYATNFVLIFRLTGLLSPTYSRLGRSPDFWKLLQQKFLDLGKTSFLVAQQTAT